MPVEIANKTKGKINLQKLKKIAERILEKYGKSGYELSIALVGDKAIRRLNRVYRGKDSVTDVLAFGGDGDFLGEIIIDCQQIKRQAGKFGKSAEDELYFILTHGLLHLFGYDDSTEKSREEMIKVGEKLLRNIKG